jgi:ribosomal protein S27E
MIQVDPAAAGQQVACPLCQGTMQVPPAEALAAAFAPPAPPAGPPSVAPAMPPVPVALMPLACPTCGGMFQVPPSAAGMQLPCPSCGQLVTIPDASALAAAVPPPAPPPAPVAETEPMHVTSESQPTPGPADIASLLPPGAATGFAAAVAVPQSSDWDVKTLLPPGASETGAATEQVPLPPAPRPVLVPPTGGQAIAIVEKPKVIGQGENEVEVKRLSPEEKARRRMVRNVILFVIGLMILLAFVVYMSR